MRLQLLLPDFTSLKSERFRDKRVRIRTRGQEIKGKGLIGTVNG